MIEGQIFYFDQASCWSLYATITNVRSSNFDIFELVIYFVFNCIEEFMIPILNLFFKSQLYPCPNNQ